MEIKKIQDNVHVFFENDCFKILNATLWKKKLEEFSGNTSQEFEKWFLQEEKKIVKIYSLKLLARKNYFSSALKQKLLQKKCSVKTIQEIIEALQKESYISDEKYLESYIEKRKRALWGPKMIHFELQKKGFSSEDSSKALDEHYPNAEEKRIQKILFSKIQKKKNPLLFLQRRGFKNPHDLGNEEIQ